MRPNLHTRAIAARRAARIRREGPPEASPQFAARKKRLAEEAIRAQKKP